MGRKLTEEEIEQGMESFFPIFLEGYRERVHAYDVNDSTLFPLLEKCSLKAYIFSFDIYLIFSKSDNDDLKIIFATEEDNTDLKADLGAPTHIFRKKLYTKYEIKQDIILKELRFHDIGKEMTLLFRIINQHQIPTFSKTQGSRIADLDYLELELQKSIRDSARPSNAYDNFDVDDLILKVKSESFEYEFTESIQAYNSELYLAASATAGIALENLLKTLIIRRLGAKSLPQKTYIRDFANVLETNSIIDERMANRVRGFNATRNSSSHTNTGKVSKEDVNQGYFLINELTSLLP